LWVHMGCRSIKCMRCNRGEGVRKYDLVKRNIRIMAKNLLDIGFLTIYIGLLSIGVMAYTTLHLKLALTQ